MARRKKETDMSDQNGVAVAEPVMAIPVDPSETPVVAIPVETPQTPVPQTIQQLAPQSNGRKPEVTYRCSSDKTTSISVSVWANRMKGPDGDWTQYSITIERSYRDQNGQWCKGGSYRGHDVPVLLYLLQKAHSWVLNMRTDDSTVPF